MRWVLETEGRDEDELLEVKQRLRTRAFDGMKVILRNPRREIEVSGKRRVKELLLELDIPAGTVLVIRGDELLTGDTVVGDEDVLEVRPVMSGGGA